MRNALNLGTPIRLTTLGADPSAGDSENGGLYYSSSTDDIRSYVNGAWESIPTQAYVASIAAGLDPKESVRAATTDVLSVVYTYAEAATWLATTAYALGDTVRNVADDASFECTVAGTSGGSEPTWVVGSYGDQTADGTVTWTYRNDGIGATLTGPAATAWSTTDSDGVTLVVGDRFLVKDETGGNAPYNGIYVVTDLGGAGPWILTRATDFDGSPDNEIDGGEYVFVMGGGTVNKGTSWTVINPAGTPVVVGTGNISFSQSGSAPDLQTAYIGGSTITTSDANGDITIAGTKSLIISATGLDDNSLGDGIALVVSGGDIDIKDNAITTSTANGDITLTPIGSGVVSCGLGLELTGTAPLFNRYDGATYYVQEEYNDAIPLGVGANLIAAFTTDSTVWTSMIVDYTIVATASGARRVGRLLVTCNTAGTVISMSDDYAESADVLVTWAATMSGAAGNLQLTSTATAVCTMQADIKRMRA